jgi:NADH-quinone oxidoreductase subunit C
LPDDETTPDVTPEGAPEDGGAVATAAPEPNRDHEAMLAVLRRELGDDAIVETGVIGGDGLVVRVRADAWARTAAVCRGPLEFDYLSFIAGIDWMPMPAADEDAEGDTSAPVQPKEMTFGVAGSAGRFQAFAHVESTTPPHGALTLKTDVDEHDPRVQSWYATYPGADWHERECWEMYGFVFDGHPNLRHLYLPSNFEGHPLRKDFPLLAREVKPWPGLVNVEAMPGEDAGDEDES